MKQIFPILFLPFLVLGQNIFLLEVQNQNNDLQVRIDNTIDFTSSDLELHGKDGKSQETFIRFDGVSLPSDAKINSIQLIFFAKDNSQNSTTIVIKGQIGSSLAYPTSTAAATGQNIKNRNYTTNGVQWKSGSSIANQEYRSPNLLVVLSQMFPNGLNNSNVAFRLTGNEQGYFNVHSFSNTNYRPKMVIDYWSQFGSISSYISESRDDAREYNSGNIDTGISYNYLGGQSDSKINGLRFQKVNIPINCEITDVFIEFYSGGVSPKASINIFSEIDNKQGFSSNSKNITNRNYTSQKVIWNVDATTATQAKFRTPNLKNIVDEVRLRESSSGTYVFMLVGTATDKGAYMRAYDGTAAGKFPRLVVWFKNNGAGPSVTGGISDPSLMNQIVINEIASQGTLQQKQDWVEIYNGHDSPVYSKGGIYLSNDGNKRDKFEIKNFYIPAKGFLSLIADQNVTQSRFNLNFKFKSSGDVYLSRKNVDTIIEQDKIKYSEISFDQSFGRKDDIGDFQVNSVSTYSRSNKNGFKKIGLVFSHLRGLYNNSFSLTLTAENGTNAQIKYTTNGSFPSETFGITYSGPINISSTTVVKAIAFGPGMNSGIIFNSFILTNRKGQDRFRGGITDADYSAALHKLPIASLSTGSSSSDPYNPNTYIISHIEYIDNFINSSRQNFGSYAGVRKFGQASAGATYGNVKAVFKWNYKSKKAKYPFFDAEKGEQFPPSNVIQSLEFKVGQDKDGPIISQRLAQMTIKQMGAYALCTKFVNVFINGRYFGLRTMRDDFKQQNFAQYFGGDDEDYTKLDYTDGWWWDGGMQQGEGKKQFLSKINENRNKPNFTEIKKLVQIDDYIKLVMMFSFYSAQTQSEAIGYNNSPQRSRFRFTFKDTDWGLKTDSGQALNGPARIHEKFGKSGTWGNLEYKTLAKDFVREYMQTQGGPMSQSAFNQKITKLQQEIQVVVKMDVNVNGNFMSYTNSVKSSMKNKVRDNINKWKNDGNVHTLFGVLIESNNKLQENQNIVLKNNNTLSQTYYTLDGSDPMGDDGKNSNQAILYSSPFLKSPGKYVVTVRPFVTNNWGPKTTKTIEIISNAPKGIFSVTGVNYNPIPDKDAEFLLISNPSNATLDISSYYIADAITYKFPALTQIAPFQTIMVGKNIALIPNNEVFGSLRKFQWEKGSLANEGEVITWNDANGNVVQKFSYGVVEPWQTLANGKGYYLKLKSEGLDKNKSDSWVATLINEGVSAGISGAVEIV